MNIQLFKPFNIIDLTSNIKILNIFFSSCNFSITKSNQNDEYLLNLRFVNYTTENGPNVNINNKGIYISLNKVFKFYKNFQIIDENKLIMPPLLKEISKNINKYNKNIIGIEDVKIFNFDGIIKIIGTSQDKIGNIKGVIGEYNYDNNEIINFKYINVTFNRKIIEKNWVYFKNFNNELKIIYKWYPLQICDIKNNNLILIRQVNMSIDFLNVRGSSCGISFNNEIWFICHINDDKNYFHLFVVFDIYMNLKKYSNKFKFQNYRIEFCLGLEIIDNKLIICYSLNDSTSIIGLYNISQLDDLIWTFIE
jgi:hypothetical protein